ncbi:hypothetical protein BJY21_001869 [Kineosphaera limosa]|uniref:Uncharacterized protein n=1 Tax=Kineosphaera limosa NBRC 100340 TaxID=1184609 RepID=K6XD76_9MICO|nr:hypothetical protein [Kineosphaera limosa]NYE00685.1 hypothetical protein [Kineosphaera limosa]GAB96774.1 hypothetical protein KILIM_048_00120 [Kineosphaera limosa NBRC 100340]
MSVSDPDFARLDSDLRAVLESAARLQEVVPDAVLVRAPRWRDWSAVVTACHQLSDDLLECR